MRPHLLFIFLLLWLVTPLASGHARLTLGAAPEATPELPSVEHAERLAAALGMALGEEVELRVFDSREELDRWLLKFTMLDLAIYDATFLAERPGKYLVIGAVDGTGKLFITSRQGATGDLPQRVAKALQQPLAVAKGKASTKSGKKASQEKPVKPKPVAQAAAPQPPASSETPPPTQPEHPLAGPLSEHQAGLSKPEPPPATPVPLPAVAAEIESQATSAPPAVPAVPAVPAARTAPAEPPGKMPPPAPPVATAKPEPSPAAPPAPGAATVPAAPTGKREEPSPAKMPEPVAVKSRRGEPPPVAPPPPLVFPELPGGLEVPLPSLAGIGQVASVATEEPSKPPKQFKPLTPAVLTPPPPPAEIELAKPAPTTPPVAEPPKIAEPRAKPEEPVKVAVPEPEPAKPVEEDKPAEVAKSAPPPVVAQPAKAEASTPIPVAVDKAVPPQPQATAEKATPAPVEQEPAETAKATEPPKPPKRVKPLLPAAPPTPPASAETEVAAKAPPAPPVVTAAPEAPAVPVPVAVDTAVKTVSVARPEPAGVAATPPPTAPEAAGAEIAGTVPSVIAQPDIPQELRPPGVPVVRPAKLPMPLPPKEEDKILAAKLPEKIGRTQKKAPLLPPPDPEPEIVYVVPFITLMVPDAVQERIFDQFVDKLNASGANRRLRFVILKEPLEKIDREWLDARKYVFGEIFGYVEDSGCCSTDLRAKARLTYYRAHHPDPSLRYEFPIRTFFEHNQTTIEVERNRIADQIANALVAELTKALQQ